MAALRCVKSTCYCCCSQRQQRQGLGRRMRPETLSREMKRAAIFYGIELVGAMVRRHARRRACQLQFSDPQTASLTAFIQTQQNRALTKKGDRKGVDVADLQTGNAVAGEPYFNGPGGGATATRRGETWQALQRDTMALSSRSRCCIRKMRSRRSQPLLLQGKCSPALSPISVSLRLD